MAVSGVWDCAAADSQACENGQTIESEQQNIPRYAGGKHR
jgi:hypothetical protein